MTATPRARRDVLNSALVSAAPLLAFAVLL